MFLHAWLHCDVSKVECLITSQVKGTGPPTKKTRVVYQLHAALIRCIIGETKSLLEARHKEHQNVTKRGERDKSATAEHALTNTFMGEHKFLITSYCRKTLYKHVEMTCLEKHVNRDQGHCIMQQAFAASIRNPVIT